MNFGDSIFRGDVKDRYSDKATSETLAFADGNDLDPKLRKAAATEGDVVNMMAGVRSRVERAKVLFRTDPAAAAEELRSIENDRSANVDATIAYKNAMTGLANPTETTESVRSAAEYLLNASYLDEEAVLPSGRKIRIGEYQSDPEPQSSVNGWTSSILTRAGFTGRISEMLYGAPSPSEQDIGRAVSEGRDGGMYLKNYGEQAKKTMEFFTSPVYDIYRSQGSLGVMANSKMISSHIDMANEISDNFDECFRLFGNDTSGAMQAAYEGLKDQGGAALLMPFCRYAASYGREHGLSGAPLMRKVLAQFKDYKNAVERSDARDATGAKDPGDFSVYENSAAVVTAMDVLSESDSKFDFGNPAMRAEAVRLGNMFARLKANGLDYTSLCRSNGINPGRDAAAALVRGATGAREPGRMVDMLSAYFDDRNRLVGGKDFSDMAFDATGRASDYLSNMDRKNGGKSSCPAADALASELNTIRDQVIVPAMFKRGMSHQDAVASMRMNYDEVSSYAAKLRGLLARRLPGDADERAQAASLVTGFILDHESDKTGSRISVQDVFESMTQDREIRKKYPKAVKSLTDWLSANVNEAVLFAPYARKMREKLKAGKMTPEIAESRVAEASYMASKLLRSGGRWDEPFTAYIYSELVPQYIKMEDGPDDVTYTRINPNRLDQTFTLKDGTKAVVKPGMYDDPRYGTYVRDIFEQLHRDADSVKEARKRYEYAAASAAGRQTEQ